MSEPRRLRRLVAGRWGPAALAAGLAAACLVELFARADLPDSPRAIVTILLLAAPVALLRSHPVAAACWTGAVFLATPNSDDAFLPNIGVLATLLLGYGCGASATFRSGLAATIGLAAATQVSLGFSEFPNIEIYIPTLGGWWVGRQVAKRARLVRSLAERNRELEAEEDAFARLSVRHERARIARELHDIVAHHLAVIVVQAGAGRLVAGRDREKTAERFASIRESGEQALLEMDRLVELLGPEDGGDATAQRSLRMLLADAEAGALNVEVAALPPEAELPATVEEVAYRVVQEALTNVIKHAPNALVAVRLVLHDSELEIEVRNDGGGGASTLAATGSGLGLRGMRERVEALGGELSAEPDAGGWRVHARVPLAHHAQGRSGANAWATTPVPGTTR